MKNTVKKVAVFALSILFVVTTVFMALVVSLHDSQTPSAKADVEISIPVTGEEEKSHEVPEEEITPETKVLLVDASGSMNNNIFASAGYDTVQKFGDYLGQSGGNSHIYTNIVRTLDMGVQIVGVVTDLESYPASDVNAISGKKYENVSLTFYLPADVNATYVKDYQANWSNALNSANSTLVFVYADGSKMVVFDAYAKEEPEAPEEVEDEKKDDSEIVVKVNTEATTGDSISFNTLVLILGTIIDLFCIFGIILIALLARSDKAGKEKDVPDDIEEAFKLPVALDGSGSVANHYASMVKYAEKLKVPEVWRFAETVEKLSTDKAKSTPAGGNTSGWKCLKEMADAGLTSVAFMTDFGFNDDASLADGISFEHITMIIPANIKVDDAIKQKVIGMCKSHKVILL
jgi:hypothetical protein